MKPLIRLPRLPFRSRAGIARDIDAELAFHVQSRVDELRAAGVDVESARRQAREEFGDLEFTRDYCRGEDEAAAREARVSDRMADIRQDAGFAIRSLRRSPGFSLLVIATLVLGISANNTMLALLDAVLFRPPALVRAPEELYSPTLTVSRIAGASFVTDVQSFPVAEAFLADTAAFAAAAMYEPEEVTWGRGSDASSVAGMFVSHNYFRVFGVEPLRGRFFSGEDDALPSGRPVAVISETFWRRALGERQDVVGSTLVLDQSTYTVIGVVPAAFAGTRAERADVWLPVTAVKVSMTGGFALLRRASGLVWLRVVARLHGGVSPVAAAAMATRAVRAAYHSGSAASATATITLHSVLPWRAGLTRAAAVPVLLATVSLFVLLTACANMATMMLTRSARREGDFAVRLALGVASQRLATMVLLEALILAVAGGAIAIGVTALLGPWLLRLVERDPLAVLTIDWRNVLIGVVTVLVVAAISGTAPAVSAARRDPMTTLRGTQDNASRAGRVLRRFLLTLQCAACVALLCGAGMFILSVRHAGQLRLGFDADKVWVAPLDLTNATSSPAAAETLHGAILDAVRALPGVASASLASVAPLSEQSISVPTGRPGRDLLPALSGGPYYAGVSDVYFQTVGTSIHRGRGIERTDRAAAPRVAVISSAIAAGWFKGEDPLGKCLQIGGSDAPCTMVVGIADDVRPPSLDDASQRPMIYLPLAQMPPQLRLGVSLVVRAASNPSKGIRRVVGAMAPSVPAVSVRSLRADMESLSATQRLAAELLTAFGITALLVAAVGIYGAFSFVVAQRRREIGLRTALGAEASHILLMVESEGIALAVVGAVVGLLTVLAAGPFVSPLLIRVSPSTPGLLLASTGLVIFVAAASSLVPAWRAMRIDPSTVLRSDAH